MVREGIFFMMPFLAGAVAAAWVGWPGAATILTVLAAFIAFFFRDPHRTSPEDPSIIVSPADGRVVRIESGGGSTTISIFLSILNVHVNRSPMGGKVINVAYRKGSFRAAFNNLASLENERNTLTIKSGGITVECSQIAGLVARRIVCWKRAGDTVEKGERIGLIRFGSRVDLTLPSFAVLAVSPGDKVKGGTSTIATLTRL